MRFYGQWNPSVDNTLYYSYFENKRNGFFIEAGACDGRLESSCKFFEESMGWNGINIEPDKHLYNLLVKERPNAINLNIALSDKESIHEFTHVVHPTRGNYFGNGSLNHTIKHKAACDRINCKYEKTSIQTRTYANIINELEIKAVDLFVLDVEGHEIEALKGMKETTIWPQVMCIEFTECGDKLEDLMKSYGYKLDQQVFNNSFFIYNK